MNRQPVEELLKRLTPPKPDAGLRNRVISAARARGLGRTQDSYNIMLKVALAALVLVVVSGIWIDRLASERLERVMYSHASPPELDAPTRELARELASILDGDDQASLEEYFARSLGRANLALASVCFEDGALMQNRESWLDLLAEGVY